MMNPPSIWAVVPAAGIGARMETDIPKQYLSLAGSMVIEHTLNRLLKADQISGLVVALNDNDEYWNTVHLSSDKPVLRASGGLERCNSVLNAFDVLGQYDDFDENSDWVLVHDAVRPCFSLSDVTALIDTVGNNESGGLLATPVNDTVKRQDDNQSVQTTVERKGLWQALTPQLFPYRILKAALLDAITKGIEVTDESSAMEYLGYKPLLIHGSVSNIKITRPEDLRLAELYLAELYSGETV